MLAAALAVVVGHLIPLISPLLWAILFGVVVANSKLVLLRQVSNSQEGAKTLLRLGVVALGSLLSWNALSSMGWAGLVIIVSSVLAVFTFTCWLGDRLGLRKGLVTLIATGFAICGAAAIAAVEGNIKRRDEDVAVALALVTFCGTAMIVVVPALGTQLGLTPNQIGVWAGASIHEVAQVVAAASVVGGASVVATAMTIKLGRVALLIVAYWGAIMREGSGDHGSLRGRTFLPWFLIGFVLVAVATASGLTPAPVVQLVSQVGVWLLAAGMFGLGLGIQFRKLFPMPWAVVILALSSTAMAALLPLGLICALMR